MVLYAPSLDLLGCFFSLLCVLWSSDGVDLCPHVEHERQNGWKKEMRVPYLFRFKAKDRAENLAHHDELDRDASFAST